MAVAFAVARGGSSHATACDGSATSTLPATGDYPLAVSVRPLHVGARGGGTYEISVTNSAARSVPRACVVIVDETHWAEGPPGLHPTAKVASGEVRSSAKLKETTGTNGPSYSILIRAPRPGREARFHVVARPASVQGKVGLTCLTVGALIPGGDQGQIGNGTFRGSLQSVCTFPRRTPPPLLPIELSLRGPSRTHTGQLSKYAVTLRNRSPQPLHDIGIGIAQAPIPPARPRAIPVATDWGLKHGTRRRNEVRVKTLGSEPITFHLWWRPSGPQKTSSGQSLNVTIFAIEAYDARTYPNPPGFVLTELSSALS